MRVAQLRLFALKVTLNRFPGGLCAIAVEKPPIAYMCNVGYMCDGTHRMTTAALQMRALTAGTDGLRCRSGHGECNGLHAAPEMALPHLPSKCGPDYHLAAPPASAL